VETRWREISRALGVPFTEHMVTDDFYLGSFSGQQRDLLDSVGLINRGFGPLCGREPIGREHYRTLLYSNAIEYLCKECYDRTNPHKTIPGYTGRYYTARFLSGLLFWHSFGV
jgi:hypothetical protein